MLPGHPEYVSPEVEETEGLESDDDGKSGGGGGGGDSSNLSIIIIIIVIILFVILAIVWSRSRGGQQAQVPPGQGTGQTAPPAEAKKE